MSGKTGFLGGWRGGNNSEWSEPGRVEDALEGFRFSEPQPAQQPQQFDPFGRPAGFDPIWGTLGGPIAQANDPWQTQPGEVEGPESEVEIFGAGFQIAGRIALGAFDRLSDWLNFQSGFIQVREATHIYLGREETPVADRNPGNLWIRLDQVVLVAERSTAQQPRAGAPVIQKQRRKVSVVTPGYHLRGSLHIHAAGSMKQFLETPEPRFIPLTELTVRWLDNPGLAARFPFAVVNREQLITILDEPERPAGGNTASTGQDEERPGDPVLQRWGAA